MKLKDLNSQQNQVYQRLDLPEWCIIMPNGDAKLVLDGSTCSCFYRVEEVEGDWQLLSPAPVLGEAVNRGGILEIQQCTPYLVASTGGWGFGYYSEIQRGFNYIDPSGNYLAREKEDVYLLDAKWLPPLPALPPEPILREKIKHALYGVVKAEDSNSTFERLAAIPEIAALLGGGHE